MKLNQIQLLEEIKKLPAINKFLYFGVYNEIEGEEIGGTLHHKLWNDAIDQILAWHKAEMDRCFENLKRCEGGRR